MSYAYIDEDRDITFRYSNAKYVEQIPPAIYTLSESMSGLYLEHQADKFIMPAKVYGFNDDFCQRVYRAWEAEDRQLGVLLWGLKGTGKTITAKVISNYLNLPVIVVNQSIHLSDFLNDNVQQDAVIFIDEIEKIFTNDSNTMPDLLSLLDGVNVSKHRRLYLFTSNSRIVSSYLDCRPSRVRYRKEFGNLDRNTIKSIIDDVLIYPQYADELFSVCTRLSLVTVDAVISFTKEVNIHNMSPSVLFEDFNLDYHTSRYQVFIYSVSFANENDYQINWNNRKSFGVYYPTHLSDYSFNHFDIGDSFRVMNNVVGEIVAVFDSNNVLIEQKHYHSFLGNEPKEDSSVYWAIKVEEYTEGVGLLV